MNLGMENDPFTVCNSPLPNVQQAINSFRIATIKRLENSILPVDSRSQYCDLLFLRVCFKTSSQRALSSGAGKVLYHYYFFPALFPRVILIVTVARLWTKAPYLKKCVNLWRRLAIQMIYGNDYLFCSRAAGRLDRKCPEVLFPRPRHQSKCRMIALRPH